jgi:hypothetical protein
MEGGVVNNNIEVVKAILKKDLPERKINSENCYSMFWEITFSYKSLEAKISGDVGGFELLVTIEGKEFPIWQYDRSVIEKSKSSEENIRYQLLVFKKLAT